MLETPAIETTDTGASDAALAAPEAVVEPLRGGHPEARRLLVVERAQADERSPTGGPQLHESSDDVLDTGPFADRLEVLGVDQACHGWSLAAQR